MRRIGRILLLSILASALLTGCGSEKSTQNNSSSSASSESTVQPSKEDAKAALDLIDVLQKHPAKFKFDTKSGSPVVVTRNLWKSETSYGFTQEGKGITTDYYGYKHGLTETQTDGLASMLAFGKDVTNQTPDMLWKALGQKFKPNSGMRADYGTLSNLSYSTHGVYAFVKGKMTLRYYDQNGNSHERDYQFKTKISTPVDSPDNKIDKATANVTLKSDKLNVDPYAK